MKQELEKKPGYKQFEYLNEEQPHVFALADLVISRAGATVLFELLALKKPNLLIPLSKNASRGDQILNAASFEKLGYSMVIQEEMLEVSSLIQALHRLDLTGSRYRQAMNESMSDSGVRAVLKVLSDITV